MLCALLAASPAQAQLPIPSLGEPLAPPSWPLGQGELRLGAEASGALFDLHQPGWRGVQASGALRLMPEFKRDYDSGLSLGVNSTLTLAHPLSRGRYDGDVI